MQLHAYVYTDDSRVIEKSLGTPILINAEFLKSTDLIHTTLVYTTDDKLEYPKFNYIVINSASTIKFFSQRKRGYFVDWDNAVNVARGVWHIPCILDVLYTYASEILASEQVIDRNENDYNLYLQDNMYAKRAYPLTQCVSEFTGFSNDYTYIVNTVAKGGVSGE